MNYKNLFFILIINNLLLIALASLAFYFYKQNQKAQVNVPTPILVPTTTPSQIPTVTPASTSTPSAQNLTSFSLCSQPLSLPITATASASEADYMYFANKATITDNKVVSTLFCTKNDSTIDLESLKTSVEQELNFNKVYSQRPSYKVTTDSLFVLFSDILDIDKLIK